MTFDRLVALYNLLPYDKLNNAAKTAKQRGYKAADLRDHLSCMDVEYDVSLRTVQRDLRELQACKWLQVDCDEGNPAQWWRKQGQYELGETGLQDAANDAKYSRRRYG